MHDVYLYDYSSIIFNFFSRLNKLLCLHKIVLIFFPVCGSNAYSDNYKEENCEMKFLC